MASLKFCSQSLDGIRNTYNWLIKKLRSTALDFIALFNKEYADSKRIGYIVKEYADSKRIGYIVKEYVDSKRIGYIVKDIKIDLGLQVPNLEVKKLKEFDFKSNDLLLTKSNSNFYNIELPKKRDLPTLLDNLPNFSEIIRKLNQNEYARYKNTIIKPNFSKIIRKLNQDEYARYIDNLSFIFPLMLVYKNFVHSDWVSDKYGNSALIELIKTCDSRKIMEEKIDLWKEKGKLTIDISLDAGSSDYINGMFPLIQKAIKNRSFIIQNYSGLYESGIEQLVTEFKDCKSLNETQKVIDDLTQNYVQYMKRCIEEKTGIKTITYDPYGVLDPVSSLKNISINVLEKYGLLSK